MGKRTSGQFPRRKQDAYDTPASAVKALLPYVEGARYWEPCAGKGDLIEALTPHGVMCRVASDIEPRPGGPFRVGKRLIDIATHDAMDFTPALDDVDFIITNPPWTRQLLHPMIDRFRQLKPTWLLFDADWMHTVQAAPFLPYCVRIVSVGRVSWMQNGVSGLDNCAWYQFGTQPGVTIFNGRK